MAKIKKNLNFKETFPGLDSIKHEGILALDSSGTIYFANEPFSKLIGRAHPKEIIGKKIREFFQPDKVRDVLEKFENSVKARAAVTFETELAHKKGFFVPVLVSQNPLPGDRWKSQGVFWVVDDLTEIKKNENLLKEKMWALEKANVELRKLDHVKSNFLSMVSHELRTPLSAIKEGVALVLDQTAGIINEKQNKYLSIVKRNIDRLANLINDLLDLSKMESGKMQMIKGPVDIRELAEHVCTTFEKLAEKKQISIAMEMPDGLPKVFADHDKTSSVLTNLLSNAVKFTPEGGQIFMRASRYTEDPNFVFVSVTDTGIGIAEEDKPKLFAKFQQLGDTISRQEGGTGLGLAICKEIIQLQGGAIWFESKKEKGSTFCFTLPIVGGKTQQKKKVLVIDDEPDLCTMVQARLEASHIECQTAEGGRVGLAKVREYKPDMILLDLMMPEVDGFQVCKALKQDRETSNIPIVVLTCLEDEESARKIISLGASGYLVKPFEESSLIFTVREFLK